MRDEISRPTARPFGTEAHRVREQVARKLFDAWTEATNPEILAALWSNLSRDDRRHWLDLADQEHLADQEPLADQEHKGRR